MRTSYIIGMVAASFLSFSLAARADHGDMNGGCNINGSETMDAIIILDATSNAPTGAAGVAKIESGDTNGNEAAEIDLKTVGLDPGDYDLSITLQSTGSNVDLGPFTVGSSSNDGDDDDQGDDNGGWWGGHRDNHGGDFGGMGGTNWIPCNWGGFTNWGAWTNFSDTNFTGGGCWGKWFGHGDGDGHGTNSCGGSNQLTVTRIEVDLPAGVDPTDIGTVTVSDSSGNPILVGNLVTPSQGTTVNITSTVQVTAGDAAPYLNGTAQIQSTASKGKWTHKFNLSAVGANAKSSYKVNVNGKLAGATRSSKTGQLSLKKLPAHTPAVRSVQVLDLHGNLAGSANF